MLLTIEVLFLRPFQCPFVRKPGQEVFGESLGRSSQWLSCPRQGTAGSEIPLKQLEPKATTNEYLEAPKERSNRPLLRSIANDGDAPKERTRRGQWYVLHDRLTEFQFRPGPPRPLLRSIANDGDAPKERSNRPLLRSLSGAAERLLRVFRLVLLSWISSSTSSWLLQGRRCANICIYHTKMRLPSAQAGSARCVRHCCLSKTKTSKRAGRSSLSRFCQDWRSEVSRSS